MAFLLSLSYPKKSMAIVVFFTFYKIIFSHFVELGNDESYYFTYAQQLQINYFDHPPMVAFLQRIFTLNLWLQGQVFFLRLGSLVCCASASYFMYKTVENIYSERAAFIAVLLYNISLYGSITAGLLLMPDAPQMLFFTLGMYCITLILKEDKKWIYWLTFGIVAGLCVMSKIHGIFLWVGMVLYTIIYSRNWFLKPAFYVSGIITLLIISPILFWNIANDFITFKFHGDRVVLNENAGLHWFGLLKEIIGQLVLNNIFTVVLVFIFLCSKKLFTVQTNAEKIFKCIGISLLLIILTIALLRSTLPHWSGPAYVALIPTVAIGLVNLSCKFQGRLLKIMLGYTVVFLGIVIFAVRFYPGTFGSKNTADLGKGDISLDSYGWQEAGEKFIPIYKNLAANSKPPLICNTWWGAHEEYFFALPNNAKMIGLGDTLQIHHYAWRNQKSMQTIKMDTAFCIIHSDEYYNPSIEYAAYYNTVDSITTIKILRGGKPAHNFYIYRLTGWKK